MTLRPEGTAPAMRAFIEEGMHQKPLCHKLFYIGPMFRYERPQAGRFRQHHQFGVEAIGISNYTQDVEVIDMLCEFYRRLGISKLEVLVNTVGTPLCRERYTQALRGYLEPLTDHLSADSKVRLHKNPLRILDSKDPEDQKVLESAPKLFDSLCDAAKEHFHQVCTLLQSLGIPIHISPKLVRGLDYYNGTVFEIVSTALGAQNTMGAGGRYDGLIKMLGGPDLPSFGCATGLERVLQVMNAQAIGFPQPPAPLAFFIGLGSTATNACFSLLSQLRHLGITAEMDLSGKKIQHGLKKAHLMKATFAIIIGEEELAQNKVQIKTMATQETQLLSMEEVRDKLLCLAHTPIDRNVS